MRAVLCKPRCAVVKLPVRPAIGIMTSRAVLTERAFVSIVCLVAGDALHRCTAEAAVGMTLLTPHRRMQPHQREPCQVVIEAHIVPPTALTMASRAVFTHATGMHVIRLMAAETLFRQLLFFGLAGMAGVTG